MEPKKSFFERYPNLEKFIGENLLNKIGIGILVLGIAYFVKYAFDLNYINETGRALIGGVAGGLLIGIAHTLRNRYRAFSSVLMGGGIAVFYVTVSIAFREYGLLNQPVAFVLMVGISALAVFMSVLYDRQELAIVSVLGGFCSPLLVSTGDGNHLVLFTYIAILNSAMLVLAYFKRWNNLNLLAFCGTAVLYGGWVLTRVVAVENAPYIDALIFGAIFYLEFFYMNVLNNVRKGQRFAPREIFLLITNTGLFYTAGMYILMSMGNEHLQGLFTAAMALINFGFALTVYKRPNTDKMLLYLLTGLVLSLLSLVAPVQFEAYSISLFWSCEVVLLYWLYTRSGIRILRTGSLLLTGLLMISLWMDWGQIYFAGQNLPILINTGFITSVVAMVGLYLLQRFLGRDPNPQFAGMISTADMRTTVRYLLGITAFATGLLELMVQLANRIPFEETRVLIYIGYFVACLGLALRYVHKSGKVVVYDGLSVLGLLSVITYWIINKALIAEIRNGFVIGDEPVGMGDFLVHYLILGLIAWVAFESRHLLKRVYNTRPADRTWLLVLASIVGVMIASVELDHLVVLLGYHPGTSIAAVLSQSHKIGFPILWGFCSFALIALGMKKRIKTLRILALSLFSLTLVKLFVFDLHGISEAGRIAAFISLGVLMLVISFLYQKLKVLLFEEEEETPPSLPTE